MKNEKIFTIDKVLLIICAHRIVVKKQETELSEWVILGRKESFYGICNVSNKMKENYDIRLEVNAYEKAQWEN